MPVSTLPAPVRRAARHLKHLPDRLLHALRRKRALRNSAGSPRSVLFVCYGNICRSPYAAARYSQLSGGRVVEVASAGFVGAGRESPSAAVTVAGRRGLDLKAHRSQLLSVELLRQYELVVVMERGQAALLRTLYGRQDGILVLGDTDPERIDTRTILDPYGRTEEVFDSVYARIDRCIASLIGPE